MTPDQRIAALALRQHGVLSLMQFREAGMTADAVRKEAKRGRFHRIHRGVYAVGHTRLTEKGHLWAAVLAVPGGALSHWSAAAVWDLAKLPSGPLHITTAGGNRSTEALRLDRREAATTTKEGLTVTTVGETLADLAAEVARVGLPRPEVNARVAEFEVDFVWRDQ